MARQGLAPASLNLKLVVKTAIKEIIELYAGID
ncbi:hypothetical protein Pse7429DRAFT_1492 [Pseudanabaena biceps PCC 7429]|uniref:Uncharacterized protein n=1 Tax=Pseudanabaena biceps PCC 7429 TaxID=927668 RepID=L8N361_9CYAN|nr:hypothetical protein Pse7429DRAFT_1492 [Pseudanabaena biceps PCC 7429]